MGEEADSDKGKSDEEDTLAAVVAGGTVLGAETELRQVNLPEGGPTCGNGGRGRSSSEPGQRLELDLWACGAGGGVASVPR